MEDYLIFIKTLVISLVSVILVSVLRVVHVYWFRPKSLEKQLRKQGIRGKTYRLFQDDMKEISMSSKEACAKPMSLNHQIAPRIFPFFHQMVQNYGINNNMCMFCPYQFEIFMHDSRERVILHSSFILFFCKRGTYLVTFCRVNSNSFLDLNFATILTCEKSFLFICKSNSNLM